MGRDPLSGPVDEVAPLLLGSVVRKGAVAVRVTEVEAYAGVGQDEASHAHRGRTKRNDVMFGPAGYLYVYFTYGMHWCLNVVCGPTGHAAAVLLRAGEVIDGLEVAGSRRLAAIQGAASPRCYRDSADASGSVHRSSRRHPAVVPVKELARGPARLATALAVDGASNGLDLRDHASPVRITLPATAAADHLQGLRVGVAKEAERPWRFWLPDEPTVSRYRPGRIR